MLPAEPRCAARAEERTASRAQRGGVYSRGVTSFFFGFYYGGSRKGLS